MKNLEGLQVKFTWLGEVLTGICHGKAKLNDGTYVYMCSKKGSQTKYPVKPRLCGILKQ